MPHPLKPDDWLPERDRHVLDPTSNITHAVTHQFDNQQVETWCGLTLRTRPTAGTGTPSCTTCTMTLQTGIPITPDTMKPPV